MKTGALFFQSRATRLISPPAIHTTASASSRECQQRLRAAKHRSGHICPLANSRSNRLRARGDAFSFCFFHQCGNHRIVQTNRHYRARAVTDGRSASTPCGQCRQVVSPLCLAGPRLDPFIVNNLSMQLALTHTNIVYGKALNILSTTFIQRIAVCGKFGRKRGPFSSKESANRKTF